MGYIHLSKQTIFTIKLDLLKISYLIINSPHLKLIGMISFIEFPDFFKNKYLYICLSFFITHSSCFTHTIPQRSMSIGSHAKNDSDFILMKQQQMPEIVPDIKGSLDELLKDSLVYPQKALIDKVEGTVFICFIVNEDKTTSDFIVLKGVRDDLNNEALRVAKMVKFSNPASQNGRIIKYRYCVPIRFQLNKVKKKWFDFICRIPRIW